MYVQYNYICNLIRAPGVTLQVLAYIYYSHHPPTKKPPIQTPDSRLPGVPETRVQHKTARGRVLPPGPPQYPTEKGPGFPLGPSFVGGEIFAGGCSSLYSRVKTTSMICELLSYFFSFTEKYKICVYFNVRSPLW